MYVGALSVMHAYMHANKLVRMYVRMYVCMYVFINECMYTYIIVCMHEYIRIINQDQEISCACYIAKSNSQGFRPKQAFAPQNEHLQTGKLTWSHGFRDFSLGKHLQKRKLWRWF